MKGVVLAGGRGTRLRPMTRIVNKHVLPIYDEPLIYYPVRTLCNAGIDEILVISNAEHIGRYIQLLEEDFDAEFSYKVQAEPKGIAHAVALSRDFVDDEFMVILGDNVVFDDLSEEVQQFKAQDSSAKIFLTEVNEPTAYGVASINDGRVEKIEEKPESPDSNYAVTGIYMYSNEVFEVIDDFEPSDRGEYEISDVNNWYAQQGELGYEMYDGEWFDAGTPEGLFQASQYVRQREQ